jgi:ABC-type nitrate/sulfonate/bicarbonate transport system substrate-binding protein
MTSTNRFAHRNQSQVQSFIENLRANRATAYLHIARNRTAAGWLSALLFLLIAVHAPAQPLTKITFPYSPINSSSLQWMVAKEAKIFDKYGLDVELVFMGASSLILQSMLSGSANLAGFAGPAIVSNVLRGGDVITVAATTPFTIAVIARPEIQRVEDLRGKKIGISRLGAVPHFAIQLILERFKVKDAVILQMGGQPEAAAGLRRGAVDAAVLSLPHTLLLQKEGYRELFGHMDYEKFDIRFLSGGIAARRSYATKNRDVVVRLIKATLEGVKAMAVQQTLAKKAFAKYSRLTDPELLEQIRTFGVETVSRDPTIPRDAIVSMARLMADFGLVDRAAVATTPTEAYFDGSYVDEIKQSGFLKELWR